MDPSERLKKLVEISHNISVDKNISIQRYFNSGAEILKSAAASEQSGDLEKAFVLYMRYVILFLEKLTNHPDYSKTEKDLKAHVKRECNIACDMAETLKAKILEKYKCEYEKWKRGSNLGDKERVAQASSLSKEEAAKEIEEKFNFSASVASQQEKVFDPFNVNDLDHLLR